MHRYIGRIDTIPGNDGYAFIGLRSVVKEDGAEHGLQTTMDIFLHKDECRDQLTVGMEVIFDVVPDRKRGDRTFRAVAASKIVECELLPADGQTIPGFPAVVTPTGTAVGTGAVRLPVHANMKMVPQATVDKVVANDPMPGVPRVYPDISRDEETKHRLTQWLLTTLFPQMAGFGADYRILDYCDVDLDRIVEQTQGDYRAMGLGQEIPVMMEQVRGFKDIRAALGMIIEENLVRPDTVIPIRYLPDIFMAVPVWYFWLPSNEMTMVANMWEDNDPVPHEAVKYFCGLFEESQRWCDTFQLFNRRVRRLAQYKGEMIPPFAIQRMRRAVELFDYVVVATPYYDMASKDWESVKWMRAIDPYILGFKKNIPFFFVLARYSDSGTFPLFNDLIGDCVEFLRANKQKLVGLNRVGFPYWCNADRTIYGKFGAFGDYLIGHVNSLIQAFEEGNLFDWLRTGRQA